LSAVAAPSSGAGWLTGTDVVAYAGIGNPGRFFRLVESLGGRLAASIVFADHHPFSEADARRLIDLAAASKATLVTTEKDWVRLDARGGLVAQLREVSRTLAIHLVLSEHDHARLVDLLTTAARMGGYRSGVRHG